MRSTHDLDRLTLAKEIDSKGYLLYESGLFNLLLRDKITADAFKEKLPPDMSDCISLLLSKKHECNLVCVNRSAANAK